jgi:hypothetical protein
VKSVSSFAYPKAVRVHIQSGDYKIEDANVFETRRTKTKRALINRSQQMIVQRAILAILDVEGIVVWPVMLTERSPQRIA